MVSGARGGRICLFGRRSASPLHVLFPSQRTWPPSRRSPMSTVERSSERDSSAPMLTVCCGMLACLAKSSARSRSAAAAVSRCRWNRRSSPLRVSASAPSSAILTRHTSRCAGSSAAKRPSIVDSCRYSSDSPASMSSTAYAPACISSMCDCTFHRILRAIGNSSPMDVMAGGAGGAGWRGSGACWAGLGRGCRWRGEWRAWGAACEGCECWTTAPSHSRAVQHSRSSPVQHSRERRGRQRSPVP